MEIEVFRKLRHVSSIVTPAFFAISLNFPYPSGMNTNRLSALADGVFAIVLTLLVLELKVPQLLGQVTDAQIWAQLKSQGAVWLGFVLSFSFLFSIWRVHHFIMSVLAKSLDNKLSNWNGFLLFFVAVVPFTAHLLGTYPRSPLAISVYAANVIAIAFLIDGMRRYILKSDKVESQPWTRREEWSANIRVGVPIISSMAAIAVSWNWPQASLGLFAFGILFSLSTISVRVIYAILSACGVRVPPVEHPE